MLCGLHVTVIGDSHVRKGIVCQDSSGHYVTDRFGIAVVADGHGSAKHFRSDIGSKLAVKITTGLLKNYMLRPEFKEQFLLHPDFILKQMEKQILMKWREAVEVYHEENPLSESEQEKLERLQEKGKKLRTAVIYGSTVLAAVIADGFSYGMVLGDGGFVVLNKMVSCLYLWKTGIPMQIIPHHFVIQMQSIILNTGIRSRIRRHYLFQQTVYISPLPAKKIF